MLALIKDNVVVRYPYTTTNLRNDNPTTSFPAELSPELLAFWGVYQVSPTPRPNIDYTQNVVEVTPTLLNGVWMQTWQVTDATPEQVAERTDSQADTVRTERNERLAACDWTQLPDAPVDAAAWATYRQDLRDVTAQAGFPWNVVWPQTPA